MEITDIIKENGTYIYNYALKLTCHPEKAEDLAQETFITAWQKLSQLQNIDALKKWLRTICYHQFLMDCRKNSAEPAFSDDLASLEEIHSLEDEGRLSVATIPVPEEEVLVAESLKELQNGCFYAMARRLTLEQRIAFSMVDMFGLSQSEAADLLEISEGALKGLLYRARMNLDAFFSDHCNLLDAKNPCSCEAWITFRSNHSNNQAKMKEIVHSLDYKEKGYLFDEHIRGKISYLYRNMPEKKPSPEWFENVFSAVK